MGGLLTCCRNAPYDEKYHSKEIDGKLKVKNGQIVTIVREEGALPRKKDKSDPYYTTYGTDSSDEEDERVITVTRAKGQNAAPVSIKVVKSKGSVSSPNSPINDEPNYFNSSKDSPDTMSYNGRPPLPTPPAKLRMKPEGSDEGSDISEHAPPVRVIQVPSAKPKSKTALPKFKVTRK